MLKFNFLRDFMHSSINICSAHLFFNIITCHYLIKTTKSVTSFRRLEYFKKMPRSFDVNFSGARVISRCGSCDFQFSAPFFSSSFFLFPLLFHGFSSFSRGRRRNVRFSRLLLVFSSHPVIPLEPLSVSLFIPPSWTRSSIANSACKGAFITRTSTNESIRYNMID